MAKVSSKPDADAVYLETGSQAQTQDLIAAQDRLRTMNRNAALKKWAPWVLGLAVVGGGVYWYTRE